MVKVRSNAIKPYFVAAFAVAISVILKLVVEVEVDQVFSPFLFLFVPVVIAAWYGGRGPGIFALVLVAVLVGVYFLPSEFSLELSAWKYFVVFSMFLIEGTLISFLAGSLHKARERAEENAMQAEAAAEASELHVTELVQTQEKLTAARLRFRRLLEANIVGVFVYDHEGVVTSGNEAFLEALGFTQEDIDFRRVNIHKLFALDNELSDPFELLDESDACDPFEAELIGRDGKPVPAMIGAASIDDRSSSGDKAICLMMELTEQKQTQNALEIALREAEVANRAKTDFLANVSHELRTPMNAIIGMTDLALQYNLPPDAAEQLAISRESAETLMQLLNDLLDFSKMQAGKFDFTNAAFELQALIEGCMRTLAMRAHDKGLEIGYEIHEKVPDVLIGDAVRVGQVINNLVNNAIKFTEVGEIFLSVTLESRQNDIAELRFCVADTGIGISEQHQKSIFAPFTQADSSTTRKYHGSGLGLTICRELVQEMHGQIWVHSALDVGSKFYFTIRLPIDTERDSDDSSADLPRLSGLETLIVDDNATNRRIVREMLTPWGMLCQEAASGAEAIEMMKSRPENPFEIVLVDALMPEMDGFELSRQINTDPKLGKSTILMLSSSSRQDFARRSKELGIEAYLEKPIGRTDLLRAILHSLGSSESTKQAESPHTIQPQTVRPQKIQPHEPSENPRSLNILVAEDTAANQKLLQNVLAKRGHHVVIAHNGQDAIAYCREQSFDVVLMDVQMPIMDGYQATAALRKNGEVSWSTPSDVPVVALTAHAMRGDRERCLAAGMDDYLSKPVSAKELIALVETISEKPHLKVSRRARRAAQIDMSEPQKTDADLSHHMSLALGRVEGNRNLFQQLMNCYIEDAPVLHADIRTAMEAEDFATLQRHVHTLKGLSSNVGGEEVRLRAAATEELVACQGEGIPSALDGLIQLSEKFATTLKNLDVNEITLPEGL